LIIDNIDSIEATRLKIDDPGKVLEAFEDIEIF